MGPVLEIIFIIIVLAGVCVLAFYATKFIAKSYQYKGVGDNIKLRDRVMLSYDKSLLIVSVGDKTLLLSVTKDKIDLLCELNDTTLQQPPQATNMDFATILKNTALSKFMPKKEEGGDADK